MDDARARVDERSHAPTVDRRGRRERYGARDASRRVASRRNVASVDARTSYRHRARVGVDVPGESSPSDSMGALLAREGARYGLHATRQETRLT